MGLGLWEGNGGGEQQKEGHDKGCHSKTRGKKGCKGKIAPGHEREKVRGKAERVGTCAYNWGEGS